MEILLDQTGLTEIESRATPYIEMANIKITTRAEYELGIEAMRTIKGLLSQIEETFAPATKAAHTAWKTMLDAAKKHAEPLEKAQVALKRSTAQWYAEDQEAIRKQQQAAAKEAAELAAANAVLGIDEPVPEPVKPVVADKIVGVSVRENWDFEIVDKSLLPREYLMPDEVKIRGVVKSLKQGTSIPGVRVYSESKTVIR